MFRTAPAAEPAPDVMVPADLIPLSVLELDLGAPVEGWLAYLNAKGVEVVTDYLGRLSISRGDARQLFDERREVEARQAEKRAAVEREAIESDQQRRSQLFAGIPASMIPADVAPAAAMLQAAHDAAVTRRVTPLQEALSRSEGMTYQSLAEGEAS
jgi:hypothetical protein